MKLKKRIIREYKSHLLKSSLYWTLAMALFAVFRYYAIGDEAGIQIAASFTKGYDIITLLTGFSLSGLLIGIVYGTVEYCSYNQFTRHVPLGLNLLLQALLVFGALILVSEFIIRIWSYTMDIDFVLPPGWWYKDRSFLPVLFYFIYASFVFSLILIISEKFSGGVFFKFLLGTYKFPKEEERIFMFLDLTSSTAIAEELGHSKYSQLLQDCFYDINELVREFEGEIYQYVGDEAVISWDYGKGLKNQRCVALFLAFEEKLRKKSGFYLEKYGLVPGFKAGVHGGTIMVAEVGVVKKELAYHGDVINTTSRIQGACKDYEASLLISERLLRELAALRPIASEFLGKVRLKGKQKSIKIHAIPHEYEVR